MPFAILKRATVLSSLIILALGSQNLTAKPDQTHVDNQQITPDIVDNYNVVDQSAARDAVNTVRVAMADIQVSQPYQKLKKHGEIELEAALLYQDIPIGELKLDPTTGNVLTKGIKPEHSPVTVSDQNVNKHLREVVQNLHVLDGASYHHKKAIWKVAVAYEYGIVDEIEVTANGKQLIRDRDTAEAMNRTSSVRP